MLAAGSAGPCRRCCVLAEDFTSTMMCSWMAWGWLRACGREGAVQAESQTTELPAQGQLASGRTGGGGQGRALTCNAWPAASAVRRRSAISRQLNLKLPSRKEGEGPPRGVPGAEMSSPFMVSVRRD